MMTVEQFLESLEESAPDPALDEVLKALWWDRKGDWDFAHSIAQSIPTVLGSAVHAYLHREEGVIWNADYWYSHAGRSRPDIPLDEEWRSLLEESLEFYRQDLP
jgi:hypothetical protein